jgi:hypothetical protein
VNRWKLAAGCIDCGYAERVEALDFDHVLGKKRFGVSQGVRGGWSMQVLIVELWKCVVRCANCHRVATNTWAEGPR